MSVTDHKSAVDTPLCICILLKGLATSWNRARENKLSQLLTDTEKVYFGNVSILEQQS
jgi:hypothetical protein